MSFLDDDDSPTWVNFSHGESYIGYVGLEEDRLFFPSQRVKDFFEALADRLGLAPDAEGFVQLLSGQHAGVEVRHITGQHNSCARLTRSSLSRRCFFRSTWTRTWKTMRHPHPACMQKAPVPYGHSPGRYRHRRGSEHLLMWQVLQVRPPVYIAGAKHTHFHCFGVLLGKSSSICGKWALDFTELMNPNM